MDLIHILLDAAFGGKQPFRDLEAVRRSVGTVGYFRDNPADQVTLPRVELKEIHSLTNEQVKQFLKVTPEDAYEIILKVILFTGLREAGATGLALDCVEL